MIEITGLDSVLESLGKLTDQDTLDLVAFASADSYRDDMLTWIDAGKAFTNRTGRLRASIEADFLGRSASHVGGGSDAGYQYVKKFNDEGILQRAKHAVVDYFQPYYAPYVEFGTFQNAAYPFFYADIPAREKNIVDIAVGILESVIKE